LYKDNPALGKKLISDLHGTKEKELTLDFIEFLIFLCLSGFEPFWASDTIEYYGYPTMSNIIGENPRFHLSTVYSLKEIEGTYGIKDFIKSIFNSKEDEIDNTEYKNLDKIVEKNKISQIFLGTTSLDYIFTPSNWLIFTPKGTTISIKYAKYLRTIILKNPFATIDIAFRENGGGKGLPYGIYKREDKYDPEQFFTADFRIDFSASFSRLLPFHPNNKDYYNWVDLIRRTLIANFALDKEEYIRKI
jgi:hypothetical protein